MDDKVKDVVAQVLQISRASITDDLAMKTTEAWDSLKHMELITSIEQAFDLQLSFDEIVAMRSVAEIRRILKEKVN